MLQSLKVSDNLSVNSIGKLLDVNPSNYYYTKNNTALYIPLEIKNTIDLIHVEHPSWGYRNISKQLKTLGINIGDHKTKYFMSEMAIHAVYSSSVQDNYSYPLHDILITKPNQVWSIGVTYIRLKNNYAFLTVIIDWYSLYILSWKIEYLLSTTMVLQTIMSAFNNAVPDIMNSDQSNTFTSNEYIEILKNHSVKISMNNKYQWLDNILEQWFRNLKYNEVYLNNYANISEASKHIEKYIRHYNHNKIHILYDYQAPEERYFSDTYFTDQ